MCVFCVPARAQIIPGFLFGTADQVSLADLSKINLQSSLPVSTPIFLQCILQDASGETLLTMRSSQFECQNGLTDLSNSPVPVKWEYEYAKNKPVGDTIRRTGILPQGRYLILCVIRPVADQGSELGRNSVDFSVTGNSGLGTLYGDRKRDKKETQPGPVSFGGYSEITGYYSNYQLPGTVVPPYYANWYLRPTISVFDFPVTAELFLSSQQMQGQQNMNRFSVSFDADQFRNLLRTRLIKFLQDKAATSKAGNLLQQADVSRLQNLDGLLGSTGVQSELMQIKQLDSLQKKLGELERVRDSVPAFSMDSISGLYGNKKDSLMSRGDSSMQSRIDSVRQKVKALEWLAEKKKVYDDLQRQRMELQSKLKAAGLDSMNVNSYAQELQQTNFSDPQVLFGKLKQHKLFKKGEELMYMVKKLSIGMSYPVNTEYTISGVGVNGVSVELERWKMYASFTYGEVQQAVLTYDPHYASYNRKVIGGTFGYGSKSKTHFHISIYSFEDDPGSINPRDSFYLYQVKPKSNQVISADFRVDLMKNRLHFFGEIAGSQTVRDVSLQDSLQQLINASNGVSSSDWFVNIFTQRDINENAVTDFAFTAGLENSIPKIHNKITVSVKRVGVNFYSLGNPFMMRNMITAEGKVQQSLWKRRIALTGFVRINQTDPLSAVPMNVQLVTGGFDITLNLPKWPMIRASMMPVVQSTDSSTLNINMVNTVISYNLRMKKKKSLLTNLVFVMQDARSSIAGQDYFMTNLSIQNILTMKNATSVSLSHNYIYLHSLTGGVHTYNAVASVGFSLFKRWNNTLGGNAYVNRNELRWGAFYQTGISFLKLFTLNVRMDVTQYDGTNLFNLYNRYFQFSTKTILIARW